MRGHALALALAACAACQLPMGMVGPQSPATLGDGKTSLALTVEAPSLDAMGLFSDERDPADPDAIPRGFLPGGSLQLGWGLSSRLDLEIRLEDAFPNPLPSAAVVGLRYQLAAPRDLELAASAHVAYGIGSSEDDFGESLTVHMARLALGAAGRWRGAGWLRPGLAATLTPWLLSAVRGDAADGPRVGLDANATVMLALVGKRVELTPFGAVGVFAIPGDRGASFRLMAGASLAFREARP